MRSTTFSLRRCRRAAAVVGVAFGVLVAGCDGRAALPDIDLSAVEAPAEAVPVGGRLVSAGWPAVAGFVRERAAEGRPVLVNAFASWCEPCKDELPLLVAAAEDNPGVTFLGVAHQDREQAADELVEAFGLPYTTVFDRVGETVFALEGTGMPLSALFDADGTLVRHKVGELTADELAGWLAEVTP